MLSELAPDKPVTFSLEDWVSLSALQFWSWVSSDLSSETWVLALRFSGIPNASAPHSLCFSSLDLTENVPFLPFKLFSSQLTIYFSCLYDKCKL